jgi:hypothetical protein
MSLMYLYAPYFRFDIDIIKHCSISVKIGMKRMPLEENLSWICFNSLLSVLPAWLFSDLCEVVKPTVSSRAGS